MITQIESELINIYTADNPILEINDVVYFLFTNAIDYHRPLIAKGIIVNDEFQDTMNKIYYIKLLEYIETPNTVNKFVINKFFMCICLEKTIRKQFITKTFDYENNLFKLEAFFVRNSLEKIIELRNDFLQILKKDIQQQIIDIEEIENS